MEYRPSSYLKNPRSYSSKSFPHFEPHISLANFSLPHPPSLDALLPSNLEPATAKFKSLHVGDKFLSSLSVTVEKTNGMMKLHDAVGAHLKRHNIETRSGRFPHMSLFYLDEATPGERQLLTEKLRKRGLVTNTRDGILLHSAIDGAPVSLPGFDGQEIWLVDCTGQVAEWKVLDRRQLSPPNLRHYDQAPAQTAESGSGRW
jgi:hypothetical protein